MLLPTDKHTNKVVAATDPKLSQWNTKDIDIATKEIPWAFTYLLCNHQVDNESLFATP